MFYMCLFCRLVCRFLSWFSFFMKRYEWTVAYSYLESPLNRFEAIVILGLAVFSSSVVILVLHKSLVVDRVRYLLLILLTI